MELPSPFAIPKEAPHLGGYIAGGDEATYYPDLWRWFVETLKVSSVLDVGCGEGHAVDFFTTLLPRLSVLGIDGVPQKKDRIVAHDYTSGPYRTRRRFDLGISTEFVEHVDERFTANFFATFRRCRMVAITFAGPGQAGHHHVNCRPEDYWRGAMAGHGFLKSDELTRQARFEAAKNPSPYNHFAQRGLVFEASQVCVRCGRSKTPDEFWRIRRKGLRLQPECRLCNHSRTAEWRAAHPGHASARHLRQKHGLSVEEYDALSASQSGRCLICGESGGDRRLNVDHDHQTGRIRGLLCGSCNRALGLLKDLPENLERAAEYLRRAERAKAP